MTVLILNFIAAAVSSEGIHLRAMPKDAHLCDDVQAVLWTPVARSDIAWNFEKFLVGPDGAPVKRYSRYFDTNDIAADIEALL